MKSVWVFLTPFFVSVGSCSCLFSFLCLNVFDCLLAIPCEWALRPSPREVHLFCHLPQGSASWIPQVTFSSSGPTSARILWHWYAEPLSSCCVAVMSQGVFLSSFLSPFPLAQFSTKASFYTVLCAYEDGGLVDLLRTELPKSSACTMGGGLSSGPLALIRLSSDFCSVSTLVALGTWNRSLSYSVCKLPQNIHDLGAPIFSLLLWFLVFTPKMAWAFLLVLLDR